MRTKSFLEKLEHRRIAGAIRAAEANTSGEIRVFIQHGDVSNPVAAARAQFTRLGMTATRDRNAVLLFVAPRSQKFAVIGDEGIHRRCGAEFWQKLVETMREEFRVEHFTDALVQGIAKAGELLSEHFPRRPDDKNELPDNVEEG
ncbi:MAG: TPM domain-containing protein [Verrucomicrobiota bacterium]|nr:TPM domain-containing protein [Chthoniobacterales bacterium]MDQ3414626.1 TPM domain-containing protein [Verrucomicrobiota bacterium]